MILIAIIFAVASLAVPFAYAVYRAWRIVQIERMAKQQREYGQALIDRFGMENLQAASTALIEAFGASKITLVEPEPAMQHVTQEGMVISYE